MTTAAAVKAQIHRAFANVQPPPEWDLVRTHVGSEPERVASEFAGKRDWTNLDAAFLDQAPGGLGSALSFLSDEAFRFFLPAYLIADLDGALQHADPVFHLTHGLDADSRGELVNPRLYGERTWQDEAVYRFSIFTREQCAAIVGYLEVKRAQDEEIPALQASLDQALDTYWRRRAAEN